MTYQSVDLGFNLYLDISKACNAKCPFCIAPTLGRKDGSEYFSGLSYSLDLTQSVYGSVQVVGGEPLISPRISRTLSAIGDRAFHRVVINTNGSRLSESMARSMADVRVTHVNISRHHYNEAVNQEIMKIHPAVSNEDVRSAASSLHKLGIDVRLNCNILKGYIDSLGSIVSYLRWASEIGVQCISFSQTFPLGLFDYQFPDFPGYSESGQVDLRALVHSISGSGLFKDAPDPYEGRASSRWGRSLWISGDQNGGHRRYWDFRNGVLVSLKTLAGYDRDRMPLPTRYTKAEDPELKDVLAFAVCHPDGLVTASWDRRERVLYNPALDAREQISCSVTE